VFAAADGHCAMTDLHTGRICHEPHRHSGGCSFDPPSSGRSRAGPRTR
jgi:hypothetical protein